MLKIFVSHSSKDADLATLLVDLLKSSLNLGARNIRCTSIGGYNLAGGVSTEEVIREEVLQAPVFIGLLSEASVASSYVLFELGARWGAGLHLVPLIAPGLDVSSLKGPLAGRNALSCTNGDHLHQLVEEVGGRIDATLEPRAIIEKKIATILAFCRGASTSKSNSAPERIVPELLDEAHRAILLKCVRQNGPYNPGAIVDFEPSKVIQLTASGSWVPLNAAIKKAAEALVFEWEGHAWEDQRSTGLASHQLERELDRYLAAIQEYPPGEIRRMHLRVYRKLADFMEHGAMGDGDRSAMSELKKWIAGERRIEYLYSP